MLKPHNLTTHQRWTLVHLVSLYRETEMPVGMKETRAPAAVERLERMGLVQVFRERGPRGGKRETVMPTTSGFQFADYIDINRLKTW